MAVNNDAPEKPLRSPQHTTPSVINDARGMEGLRLERRRAADELQGDSKFRRRSTHQRQSHLLGLGPIPRTTAALPGKLTFAAAASFSVPSRLSTLPMTSNATAPLLFVLALSPAVPSCRECAGARSCAAYSSFFPRAIFLALVGEGVGSSCGSAARGKGARGGGGRRRYLK